jgi:hypothetical protein
MMRPQENQPIAPVLTLQAQGNIMPPFTICYNLAVSCWLGGAALFTFLLTPKLFAAYPRDLAGNIVGLLFPGYFRWALACGAVALLCRLIDRRRFAIASLLIITSMLALTSIQAFVLEPRAAALKQSIPSFETTAKDDPLRVQFRTLHSLSMAANLTVIVGGVMLVILASLPAGETAPQTAEPEKIASRADRT